MQSAAGTVMTLDRKARTITLRHDGMGWLGVPAGTSTLDVRDDRLLPELRTGMVVRFNAQRIDGRAALVGWSTRTRPADNLLLDVR